MIDVLVNLIDGIVDLSKHRSHSKKGQNNRDKTTKR
jgi:hypothetical protein